MPQKKLSDAEKAALKAQADKERELSNLARELKELRENHYPVGAPKYRFEVGDRVVFGAHDYSVITEVLDDGLIYKTHTQGYSNVYGKPTWYEQYNYHSWVDIYPHDDLDDVKPLFPEHCDNIDYYKTHLDNILCKYYQFGVDDNPEYQRDYVWSQSDKVELIDSIFNYLDIGKFLFNKLNYSVGKARGNLFYEIIDGKQRCRAILDFYENKFTYKGKYFYQLCYNDRVQFKNFGINVAEVDNYSTRDAMRLFLRVNTTGRVMDKIHLENVLQSYKSLCKVNSNA